MDIKEFLELQEVKDLIANGQLELVYNMYANYFTFTPSNKLTEYLLNLGINPVDYFNSSIPNDTFFYCEKLPSIIIPDNITTIGRSAFNRCINLTTINIPASVIDIKGFAFYGCFNLTDINYAGTKEQWENITKHQNWKSGSPIKFIHCADGDIDL